VRVNYAIVFCERHEAGGIVTHLRQQRDVEPTTYNNMSLKDFRAMLDRLKLTMPNRPVRRGFPQCVSTGAAS
jgi:hypothetical protein